jgi:PAS domain S-box-containing protein
MEKCMNQVSRKILMVDDDEEDYFIVRQMLSRAARTKYTVDWASTYEEAWDRLQQDGYDAVLMDYDLGFVNGLELTRKAVAQNCRFPIILYTGRGSDEIDRQAMQAGAAFYLTKDEANPLLLERGIRYAIERKQAEDSLQLANQKLQDELLRRERAEQAHQESECKQEELSNSLETERAYLAAMLNNLPVGVWIADREGRLISKNRQADLIWAGEAPLLDSLADYPRYTAWYPGSQKTLLTEEYPMLRALQEGRMVEPVELEIRRFDGTHGAVLVSAAPVWNPDGSLMGVVGINLDISERRQMVDDLHRSEERFSKAFNATPNPLALSRLADGKIEQVNDAFVELFGYSRAEAIGKTSLELNMLPDPDAREPRVEHIRAARSVRGLQTPIRLKSGEVRQASLSVEVLEIEQEPYILTVIEDITQRSRAEKALRQSEAQQQALILASSQVLYRMSADWKEMRQLQGGSFLADTARPNWNWLDEYIHPVDQPRVLEVIEKAVQSGTVFELEHRVQRADGSLGWTASRAVPVRDEEGQIIEWFGAASDISDRKQVEIDRERLLEENQQQRRFLERIIQSVPVAIAVLKGPEYRYTLANPHQELLTRGKGPLLGGTVAEVWVEGLEQVLPILDQVYQTGEPFSAEGISFNIERDQGPEQAFFNVSYIPLQNGSGSTDSILALAVETSSYASQESRPGAQPD